MISQAITNKYLSKFGHIKSDSSPTLNMPESNQQNHLEEQGGSYPPLPKSLEIPSPPGNEGNTLKSNRKPKAASKYKNQPLPFPEGEQAKNASNGVTPFNQNG